MRLDKPCSYSPERRAIAAIRLLPALLLFWASLATAQSKEQTLQWLSPHLAAATQTRYTRVDALEVTASAIQWTRNSGRVTAEFKDVSSITLLKKRPGHPPECADCEYVPVIKIATSVQGKTVISNLDLYAGNDEEGARIVKALQHLATLNGARLVDDSLF